MGTSYDFCTVGLCYVRRLNVETHTVECLCFHLAIGVLEAIRAAYNEVKWRNGILLVRAVGNTSSSDRQYF
jgi:hypothetical protein